MRQARHQAGLMGCMRLLFSGLAVNRVEINVTLDQLCTGWAEANRAFVVFPGGGFVDTHQLAVTANSRAEFSFR